MGVSVQKKITVTQSIVHIRILMCSFAVQPKRPILLRGFAKSEHGDLLKP